MLQTLYIENIAVIEKTSIDFSNGLNVLTGEKGAGKSIIIDAINAIMGQRTSKDIIRTGEQSAFVSAQFENINNEVSSKLEELGFSDDEGVLILQRMLNSSGKSSCKINGRPATVSMLKELSKYLINIHGQHESYELFSPETHIDYIDSYGKSSELLAEYNPESESLSDTLSDVYYNLKDCAESISEAIDNLESDPQRLEEIEERLDLLNRLSRKYNCPCDDLIPLAENMQSRLDELVNFDKNRDELIEAVAKAENLTMQSAQKLSKHRKKVALDFAKKVKEEMSFLNMPNVELVPQFEITEFNPKGIDKVELLISANPGETPRPVAKIASGGELSRMMLAIKTVLSASDTVDTLIFDEVDTGISGSAAEKVGLKLKQVSENSQVLCVTHQAQIAALADHHYLIRKQIDDGRTFTDVSILDHNGRVNELARIIGGVNITEAALTHAESMLNEYNN